MINTRYKIIADLINDSQDRGGEIVSNLNQMLTELENSEIRENDVERERLEDRINITVNVLTIRHVEYTGLLLNFVRALQDFINRNYESVNIFLNDNRVLVKPVFADISAAVGYSIDAENIDNTS